MRRGRGHFLMPIEISTHLIECNPGHISNSWGALLNVGKLMGKKKLLLQTERPNVTIHAGSYRLKPRR